MKEKKTSDRKKEHIELALRSRLSEWENDRRFYYEPLLGRHPGEKDHVVDFFGKTMRFPIWVSSMTGGTAEARKINERLAKACSEFGLGMGLGSCRPLLEDPKKYLGDFALRNIIGTDSPFYANIGVAQLEKALAHKDMARLEDMVSMLDADGLIIHVNPLQEWIQPEGDRFVNPPIESIEQLLALTKMNIIVKEVGQGMGPGSLRRLMTLPVIIEFAAFGGTNFSLLEMSRRKDGADMVSLANIGHTMEEMILYFNKHKTKMGDIACKGVILSGGVKDYLDGYYAVKKIKHPAVYGQASVLLKYARESYKSLRNFLHSQIEGYNMASELLKIRP